MAEEGQGLTLNWAFGSSTNVRSNVVNLSDGFSERIAYVAAHTAVIYDKRTRRQIFLQGHCNSISCIAVTDDRATIITADVGSESLMVLWNAKTGNPIRSISQPHKHGIVAMDISPDGQWLATISMADPQTAEQEIALWSWSSLTQDAAARPAVLTAIPAGDPQLCVRFNMNNPNELISNGRRRVYFWTFQWPASGRFKYYSPPLRQKDFKQSVGDFVASVFVPGSTQAITATTDGDLVVWDEQGIMAQMGTRPTDRRAIKLMRVHQQAITHLSTIGDYLVTGGQDGYVRFYDPLLRIVAWFEDLDAGPIVGLSFSSTLPSKVTNTELADTLNRFIVPDFVVTTEQSRIVAVSATAFEEFDVERRRGALILEPMLTDVVDLVTHPTRAEFAVLGSSGLLQRWDMVTHACIAQRQMPRTVGSRVAYSRDGNQLVLGCDGGFVYILKTEDLSEVHTTRNTSGRITMVACSTTGDQVAVADDTDNVLLYSYMPYKHMMRWEFIGKSRTHHGKVVGLNFGETPAGQTRLFSLGADGRVAEYDLSKSSPATGLKLTFHQDFSATAKPTAMCFAPPLQYFRHHSTETLLLVCDDQYKARLFNPDSKASVATMLGPTFGGPINQVVMFKSNSTEASLLAYATAERVVGLIAWPMDGDPARTMGLIAHPGAVRSIGISYDGRKLITCGVDGTLNMWDIHTSALETAATTSNARPDRWARVLGSPELLDELKDYFYYAQIKAQGEDAMAPRRITGSVPKAMVPDIMRAAGFYPSEDDIQSIMHHISFIAHGRDMDDLDEVGFEDLLCLYVNHRPLAEASQADVEAAFAALGAMGPTGKVAREVLQSVIQSLGEPMGKEELLGALNALTGATRISEAIPTQVDAMQFSSEVLGFEAEVAE